MDNSTSLFLLLFEIASGLYIKANSYITGVISDNLGKRNSLWDAWFLCFYSITVTNTKFGRNGVRMLTVMHILGNVRLCNSGVKLTPQLCWWRWVSEKVNFYKRRECSENRKLIITPFWLVIAAMMSTEEIYESSSSLLWSRSEIFYGFLLIFHSKLREKTRCMIPDEILGRGWSWVVWWYCFNHRLHRA